MWPVSYLLLDTSQFLLSFLFAEIMALGKNSFLPLDTRGKIMQELMNQDEAKKRRGRCREISRHKVQNKLQSDCDAGVIILASMVDRINLDS